MGGGGRSQVFRMTALRDISAGEQVHDSYGYKSNERYLLNYGFSLEHNVGHDGISCPNEVPLPLTLDVLSRLGIALEEEKIKEEDEEKEETGETETETETEEG